MVGCAVLVVGHALSAVSHAASVVRRGRLAVDGLIPLVDAGIRRSGCPNVDRALLEVRLVGLGEDGRERERDHHRVVYR